MTEPRAGSRKAAVYHKWKEEGAAAAGKLAKELGLAGSTVNSWVGGWSKGKDKVPKDKPDKKAVPGSKDNRVQWSADPTVVGYVKQAGPEVSVVKWDDGRERNISNDQLVPYDPNIKRDGITGTDNDFSMPDLDQWERQVFNKAAYFTVYRKLARVKDEVNVRVKADTKTFKDFPKAALEADKFDGSLLYAVTAAGRSCCLPRKRWKEYLAIWKEKHNL